MPQTLGLVYPTHCVTTYLLQVDPKLFAVSVMTVDGQSFNFGDSREWFALQSVAAPITYAIFMHLSLRVASAASLTRF